MNEWDELRHNPPEDWRKKWEAREKIRNCDTQKQAERWKERLQKKYESELLIDLHVKDGYVIYFEGGRQNV